MTTRAKDVLAKLHQWFDDRRAGSLLLVVLAVVYTAAYFTHPLFPGHTEGGPALGWWTWSDQNYYLKSCAALAQFRLDAETWHYPLGYPALGALFWRWMPVNPFFIPDLALVLAGAWVWWRLAQRFLRRLYAAMLAVFFILTHASLLGQTMVIPWNTLPTQLTLLAGVWIVLTDSRVRAVGWLAGLAAVTYWVRPIDAAAFAPLLVFATLRLASWPERITAGAGGLAILAVAVGAMGWLSLSVFGSWNSPYEAVTLRSIGFFSYPVSYKLYWLFVDGGSFFGETEPGLLLRYPWLFLALPGAIHWVVKDGWAAVAALGAVGLSWMLYINYNDFLPSDIYRFTLIHYLTWAFPLLALLAAASLRGWRNRWTRLGWGLALAAMVVTAGLRLEERELQTVGDGDRGWPLPERRPLLLRFPGAPAEAVTSLRVDGRTLTEYSHYLTPLLPFDLRVLLGTKTNGTILTVEPKDRLPGPPQMSDYGWAWRLDTARLNSLGR